MSIEGLFVRVSSVDGEHLADFDTVQEAIDAVQHKLGRLATFRGPNVRMEIIDEWQVPKHTLEWERRRLDVERFIDGGAKKVEEDVKSDVDEENVESDEESSSDVDDLAADFRIKAFFTSSDDEHARGDK